MYKNVDTTLQEYYLKDLGVLDMKTGNWSYYASSTERFLRIEPDSVHQPKYNASIDSISISNGERFFYETDHLGNTRIVFSPRDQYFKYIHFASDFYPYGKILRQFVNTPEKYQLTGKQRDEETELDYFGARYYDASVGKFLGIDPLAQKFPGWSTYSFCFDNPVHFVDPDGRAPLDDYFIKMNGEIEVVMTNDNFDRFYLKTNESEGQASSTTLVGQFNKNENGLIQLPSHFSFENTNFETSFSFNVKEGNEYRSYIRGDAFSSLIGALAETNTKDLTVVGFSLSDGSSPAPSVSHKNGINGDLRYLRTDQSGTGVLLGQQGFDMNRQNVFNNALYHFGWTNMLSERFTPNGQTGLTLLNHTSHYSKSRHNNHLHLQGYNPNLLYILGTLPTINVFNQK